MCAPSLKANIEKREKVLYECALAVENDIALTQDMTAWEVAMNDGLLTDEGSKKE